MKTFRIFICASFLLVYMSSCRTQSPSINTYVNPVIPGDHSDCTLTKIGDDFYTTGSSFNPTPVIYHSKDLVHWEAIAQPVSAAWTEYGDKDHAGCWGGQVVFYNKKYWNFFSHGGTMCVVTADRVEGPWSLPTRIRNPKELSYTLGYDNSIFIDDDGKWYMVVKNGQPNNGIVELDKEGQPTGVVYDLNWLNPKDKNFPFSWAEGPVIWKEGGFYYYSCAHDVSGGQKVLRSKVLSANQKDWTEPVNFFDENDKDKPSAIFTGPNHSSAAVKLSDGTSWVIHPVWARANKGEWIGQGRQGLLNQVRYLPDGNVLADYPSNKVFQAPKLPSGGISWMVPKSDFFNNNKLNPEWSFLGYTPDSTHSLTARTGWLRMKPRSESRLNTVIKTDAEHNYSLITKIDYNPISPKDEAGIRLMNGDETMEVKVYASLAKDGRKSIYFSFLKTVYEVPNTSNDFVWLKMVRVDHVMTAFVSNDGMSWSQIGKSIDVTELDRYSFDYNGWCGNRQGLYVKGSTPADFDLYIYRDAYTIIPANSPANWFGTTSTVSNGTTVLSEIHHNDWVMYAGVEFGSEDYKRVSDSIILNVMNVCKSGTEVEVWIDGIENGKQIALIKLNANSEKVVNQITSVKGRHDVFLRFVGKEKGDLMQLVDIQFKSKQ